MFTDAEAAASALTLVDDRAQCMVELFNDGELDDDEAEFSDASFSKVSFPDIGDSTAAYRLKIHVKARGESGFGSEADIFLDIVQVSKGRVAFSLQASDILSPYDVNHLQELAEKAESKLPDQ